MSESSQTPARLAELEASGIPQEVIRAALIRVRRAQGAAEEKKS